MALMSRRKNGTRLNRNNEKLIYYDASTSLWRADHNTMKSAQSKKRIKRRGKDSFEPRKTYVKGEVYWQVNLPIEYKMVDGKRVRIQKRRTLKDREEAETIAEQAR